MTFISDKFVDIEEKPIVFDGEYINYQYVFEVYESDQHYANDVKDGYLRYRVREYGFARTFKQAVEDAKESLNKAGNIVYIQREVHHGYSHYEYDPNICCALVKENETIVCLNNVVKGEGQLWLDQKRKMDALMKSKESERWLITADVSMSTPLN